MRNFALNFNFSAKGGKNNFGRKNFFLPNLLQIIFSSLQTTFGKTVFIDQKIILTLWSPTGNKKNFFGEKNSFDQTYSE